MINVAAFVWYCLLGFVSTAGDKDILAVTDHRLDTDSLDTWGWGEPLFMGVKDISLRNWVLSSPAKSSRNRQDSPAIDVLGVRSGKLTVCYWKWPSRNRWFTHQKYCDFSVCYVWFNSSWAELQAVGEAAATHILNKQYQGRLRSSRITPKICNDLCIERSRQELGSKNGETPWKLKLIGWWHWQSFWMFLFFYW